MPSSVGDDLVVRLRARRRAPASKPSPTSTPLIAWMPISAPASRESSRRSQCTCEPRPGRQAVARPPRPRRRGCRRPCGPGRSRATICLARRRRRGSAPGRRRAAPRRRAPGTAPSGASDAAELDDVARRSRAPTACLRKSGATRAQRDPGGGLAGAGALEDRAGLVEAVLLHARQVGVAGARAGQRRVARRARPGSPGRPGRPTSPVSHLGHSVLPTWIATGPPWVSPCRTPPRKVTSSCSNFIRAPRP